MWGATGDRLKEGACWDLLVDLDSKKGGPKWLFWRCADQPLTFCLGKCHQCTYGEELGRLGIGVADIMSSKQKLSGKPHQKRFLLRRSTRALPRLQIDTLTAGFTGRKLLHCHLASIKNRSDKKILHEVHRSSQNLRICDYLLLCLDDCGIWLEEDFG